VAAAEAQTSAGDSSVRHLKRVLSAWDLILYGVVAVTPSAPATVFGLAETKSHGFAVVTILASMVAMVLTAVSYGRMAAVGCIPILALCRAGRCSWTMS
jgi:hypothetical protein